MNYSRLIFFIALLLSGTTCISQEQKKLTKRCPVKTLNYAQGLLNNGTTNIITDDLGYTWVSTKTGLQRFNGYRLETIVPVIDKQKIFINYSVFLLLLKNGTIWIGMRDGVISYDTTTHAFHRIITIPVDSSSQAGIVPLKETDSAIWCLHSKKGVVVYDKTGKLLKTPGFIETSLLHSYFISKDLFFGRTTAFNDNYLFIACQKDDILCINTKNMTTQHLHLTDQTIYGMTCNEKYLFVTTGTELKFFNPETKQNEITIPLSRFNNEEVSTANICIVGPNEYLVSINNHLYEFDAAFTNIREITDLSRNPVLATGYIFQIYPDRHKCIWLLTNNDIRRIQNTDISFMHFLYPNAKNNFVKSIYYDEKKGVLFAGCFNGGLQLYDTASYPLEQDPFLTSHIKDVMNIEKLTDNEYLVLTFGNGWYIFNYNQKTFTPFIFPKGLGEQMKTDQVSFGNNLQRIDSSTLFISTAINVFRCRFSGTKLISSEPLLPVNADNINCFIYSSKHVLWTGTHAGTIYSLDPEKKFSTFYIPGSFGVRSLAEDRKGNIWVGTDKGLYVFSDQGQMIRAISVESGLLNDCIYALLPAPEKAGMFASTNLGLSYITLDGTIRNFTKETGLQENEFNTGAAIRTKNGKYYFGGINGISGFYPSSLSVVRDTPSINIARFVVNDSSLNFSTATRSDNKIHLYYNQNHIRLDLAALGMLDATEYVYRYRLVGFENAWQTTYDPEGINYILGPGSYTLEVQCSPVLSSETTFTRNFQIIIHPPWWKTWWFRLIAILVFIGAMGIIFQQYNSRKYQKKIQALQLQQQLQQERERISRELHDDLGTSANMLMYNASLLDEENSANDILQIKQRMQDTSRDMLQSLRETVWTLKQQTITTADIWTRIKNFISKLQQTYKNILFRIDEAEYNEINLNYNKAFNLVRIIQEAVNNAIKHSGCTEISCTKRMDNEKIMFVITDNGKGFNFDEISKTSDGNGLQNMQQRANESGLSFELRSEPGKGTSISIGV